MSDHQLFSRKALISVWDSKQRNSMSAFVVKSCYTNLIVNISVIIISNVVLLSVALINRYPLINADTIGYLRNGDFIADIISSSDIHETVRGGRSIFYASFVHLLQIDHLLWLVVIIQSLIIICLLNMIFEILFPAANRLLFLLMTLLVMTTSSLPWFVGMVMPDIFTAVTIICMYLLGFYLKQLNILTRFLLMILLAFSVLSHTSNLLTSLILIITIFIISMAYGNSARTALINTIPSVISISLAVFLSLVTSFIISGRPQIASINSPPFVLARLLEDGTAKAYLEQNCPHEHFAICQILGELPNSAHSFRWAKDNRFINLVSRDDEDAIVLATVRTYPAWQFRCAITNFFGQLITFGVEDVIVHENNYPALEKQFPDIFIGFKSSLQFRQELPLDLFSTIHKLAVVAGITICVATFYYSPSSISKELRILTKIFVIGLLANAAFTGILSDVAPRYEARAIWLLVFLSILYVIAVSIFNVNQQSTNNFLGRTSSM